MTGEIKKEINAKEVFRKIAESNWRVAEPGFLLWDKINKWNFIYNNEKYNF